MKSCVFCSFSNNTYLLLFCWARGLRFSKIFSKYILNFQIFTENLNTEDSKTTLLKFPVYHSLFMIKRCRWRFSKREEEQCLMLMFTTVLMKIPRVLYDFEVPRL